MQAVLKRKELALAVCWLVLVGAAVIFAPFFFSKMAYSMNFSQVLASPSAPHLFGTDFLGRDLFARTLVGARISLGVAVCAIVLSVLIGVVVGALAGYYGKWVDRALMSLVDILLCFPVFFLILAVIAIVGPSIWNVVVIIGLTSWMGTARLVRAEVLTLKEREFVLAARVLKAPAHWILSKHLVPNAVAPVIVNGILSVSSAILIESGLSFLGVGVQPPAPSWGNLLLDGKSAMGVAWWVIFFPGALIFLTVLAVNVIGEELHEKILGR